jgi:DNA-binding transcriptional LysR family regulator
VNIESLSIDQMRAALAVAELGSFSGAARKFKRAQSAVSYAVTTLERQLGVALFDRTDGAAPQPTEAGRVLMREMEAVVRRADEIKNQARDIGKGLEHELPVTIDSLFPLGNLTETLKEFDAEFPTVQIHIKVEAMGAVQSDVLETRSTVGIIGSLPHLPAGLIGDAITSVTRFPVAARDHPLAQGHPRKRLPQRLLLDHIQILQSDRSNMTLGRDFSVYTGRTWRVSDLATKRTLICNGIGWGYLPQHDIAEDIASGVLRRVWVENLRDQNAIAFLVVRRRDRVLGPASRWLLNRLIKTKSNVVSTVMHDG